MTIVDLFTSTHKFAIYSPADSAPVTLLQLVRDLTRANGQMPPFPIYIPELLLKALFFFKDPTGYLYHRIYGGIEVISNYSGSFNPYSTSEALYELANNSCNNANLSG